MTRNTSSGSEYKDLVELILQDIGKRNGFKLERSVVIGTKPSGTPNRFDFSLTRRADERYNGLVSCRVQSVSGSAEEKVAYEVIRLLRTMRQDRRYQHGWLILGGSGWSEDLVDFYTNEMKIFIPRMDRKITVLRTDELMSASISI